MSKNLLGNTVYLTKSEYDTLYSTGEVTLASGEHITYSENDIYYVPESNATTSTAGLMSANDKDKLDHISTYANKVEGYNNIATTPSNNGYIKIDGTKTLVYDDSALREFAAGKTGTYVLSTAIAPSTAYSGGSKFYKADGTELTTVSDFNTYVSGLTLLNTSESFFKSNNADFTITSSHYMIINKPENSDVPATMEYTVVKGSEFLTFFRIGDVFLVTETDYPDRWWGGNNIFYKMETSKIDLSHVVYDNAAGNTISATKTFSVFPQMSSSTSPTSDAQFTTKYYTDNTFLKLSGGTMTGDIYMGNKSIWFGSVSSNKLKIYGSNSSNVSTLYISYGSSSSSSSLASFTHTSSNGNYSSLSTTLSIDGSTGSTTRDALTIYTNGDHNRSAISFADERDDDSQYTDYNLYLYYPDETMQRSYLGAFSSYDNNDSDDIVIPELIIRETPLTVNDNATLNTYTNYIAPIGCKLTDNAWKNLVETNYTSYYYAAPGADSNIVEMDFNNTRDVYPKPISSGNSDVVVEGVLKALDSLNILVNIDGTDRRVYDSSDKCVDFDERYIAIRNLAWSFRDLGRYSARSITLYYSNGFNIDNRYGTTASNYDACEVTFNVYDDDDNLIGEIDGSVEAITSGTDPKDIPIHTVTFQKPANSDARVARVEVEADDIRTRLNGFWASTPGSLPLFLAEGMYDDDYWLIFDMPNNVDFSPFFGLDLDNIILMFDSEPNRLYLLHDVQEWHGDSIDPYIGYECYSYHNSQTVFLENGYLTPAMLAGKRIYITGKNKKPSYYDNDYHWVYYTPNNTATAAKALDFFMWIGTYKSCARITHNNGTMTINIMTTGFGNGRFNNRTNTTIQYNGDTYRLYNTTYSSYNDAYGPAFDGIVGRYVLDGTLDVESDNTILMVFNGTDSSAVNSTIKELEATTSSGVTWNIATEGIYQTKAGRLNIYKVDFVFDKVIYTYQPLANKDKVEKLIYDKVTSLQTTDNNLITKSFSDTLLDFDHSNDIADLHHNSPEVKIQTYQVLPTNPTASLGDTLAYYNGNLYKCVPDDSEGYVRVTKGSAFSLYSENESDTPAKKEVAYTLGLKTDSIQTLTDVYRSRHALKIGAGNNKTGSPGSIDFAPSFTDDNEDTYYIKCLKLSVAPWIYRNAQTKTFTMKPVHLILTATEPEANPETYVVDEIEISEPTEWVIDNVPGSQYLSKLTLTSTAELEDDDPEENSPSGQARFLLKGGTVIADTWDYQDDGILTYSWEELGSGGGASADHNHDDVYLKKSAISYTDGVLTISLD